ncbi:MAG: hypothetical protein DRO11_00005 [Methanobacteriota archaeon]|nr:MAG: hypothetical protein DRO11_00005 [Euryarchaeota archaeon]
MQPRIKIIVSLLGVIIGLVPVSAVEETYENIVVHTKPGFIVEQVKNQVPSFQPVYLADYARLVVARIDPEEIDLLEELPTVEHVEHEIQYEIADAERGVVVDDLRSVLGIPNDVSGAKSIVAVVDTGFTGNEEKYNVVWSHDFTGYNDTRDYNGHGTAMISIIHSIAPKAKILNAKALDKTGSTTNTILVRVIDQLIAHKETGTFDINIINIGLGTPTPRCCRKGACSRKVVDMCGAHFSGGKLVLTSVEKMIIAARDHGILTVIAGGNEGHEGEYTLTNPATVSSIVKGSISVGSIELFNDEISPFSSRGPAYTGGIGIELVAYGSVKDGKIYTPGIKENMRSIEGTSVSTAVITGIAALLVEKGIEECEKIELVLENYSVDLGVIGPDPIFGHGKVDIPGMLGSDLSPYIRDEDKNQTLDTIELAALAIMTLLGFTTIYLVYRG